MFPIRKGDQPVRLVLGLAGIVAGVFFCGGEDGPRQARGAPSPPGQPDGKAVRPIPFPDGVVGPRRRTAFVSSPRAGIQAIRLEDGKVLWTNDEVAARPWLVAGPRLVAL